MSNPTPISTSEGPTGPTLIKLIEEKILELRVQNRTTVSCDSEYYHNEHKVEAFKQVIELIKVKS